MFDVGVWILFVLTLDVGLWNVNLGFWVTGCGILIFDI